MIWIRFVDAALTVLLLAIASLFAYREGHAKGVRWGARWGARVERKRLTGKAGIALREAKALEEMTATMKREEECLAAAVEIAEQMKLGLTSKAGLSGAREEKGPLKATVNERPRLKTTSAMFNPSLVRPVRDPADGWDIDPDDGPDTEIQRFVFDDPDAISAMIIHESIEEVRAPKHLRDLGRGEPVDVEIEPGQWKRAIVWTPPERKDGTFLVGVRGLDDATTSVFELDRVRRPVMPRPR